MVNQAPSNAVSRTHPHRRRQFVVQLIVAAVIFASGTVVGAGGIVIMVKQRVIRIDLQKRDAAAIAAKLKATYGLNQEQTGKVEGFIKNIMDARKLLRQEMDTKFALERTKLVNDMKTVLSAEQFSRWHRDFQDKVGQTHDRGGS